MSSTGAPAVEPAVGQGSGPGDRAWAGRRRWSAAALVALGTFAAALLVLFAGPDLGLADNTDGRRLMCQVGLAPAQQPVGGTVAFELGPAPPDVIEGCADENWRYPTSFAPVVRVAVMAHQGVLGTDGFDLRSLAVLSAALLSVGAGLLAAVLAGPLWWRVLVSGGLALAVLDTGLAAYLASPYAEAGGFVGLVLLLAAAVSYLVRDTVRAVDVALVVAAALFVGTVKAQLAPMLLIAGGVLLLRAWSRGGRGRGRLRPWPVLGVVIVVAAVPLFLGRLGEDFSRANRYHLLFTTLLPGSDRPDAALSELGLPPELGAYAGTYAYGEDTAFAEPSYAAVERDFDRGDAVRYWLAHPAEGLTAVGTVTAEAAGTRVEYLAMTEQDPEEPIVVVDRWEPGHLALAPFRALPWPFLWLAWGVVFVAGSWSAARHRLPAPVRQVGALAALLATIAASQVVVTLLGDGYYEARKHLVFSAWASVALVPVVLAMVLRWSAATGCRRRRGCPRPGSPSSPPGGAARAGTATAGPATAGCP